MLHLDLMFYFVVFYFHSLFSLQVDRFKKIVLVLKVSDMKNMGLKENLGD